MFVVLSTTVKSFTVGLGGIAAGLTLAMIHLATIPVDNTSVNPARSLGAAVFSGTDAAAYGLVTTAVPADRLDEEVRRVCDLLATGAAQGLRESKAILNRDLVARIDAHGEEMAALSARLFASDEARAAMTAFLNRKK